MFLMAWRLTKLAEAGSMSHEQASLVKAWNTLRGREVGALLQGSGIQSVLLQLQQGNAVVPVGCTRYKVYRVECVAQQRWQPAASCSVPCSMLHAAILTLSACLLSSVPAAAAASGGCAGT
jgi:hypothetical protein